MGEEQTSAERTTDDQPETTPRNWWQRLPAWGKVAVIAAPVIVIVGIVAAVVVATSAYASPFKSALEECGLTAGGDAQILDDGNGLLLDSQGDDSGGLSVESVACVLIALDVPDAILSKMDSTRALDGRQSDEFDGITVEWTYHPDDGLDVLFTR